MMYTLMIAGMALITVFIKAAIFMLGERATFPIWLKEALAFVPVTVLTAIIVPMILAPHGQDIEFTWRNPQLIAATAAVLVCAGTRKQLLTIMVGLVVFFAWQFGVLGQ